MKKVFIERMAYPWGMPVMWCVVLKEQDTKRRIRILIGQSEGLTIVRELERLPTPRPMTHDLLGTMLATLHGTVKHVIMTEVKEETFYATIVLESQGTTQEIDAQPSDALALAVREHVSIFAEDALLEWAEGQDVSKSGPFSTLWPFPEERAS